MEKLNLLLTITEVLMTDKEVELKAINSKFKILMVRYKALQR